MDQIPRLTDLIPRSLWPYGLALVVGIGMIAGLEWLYAAAMPQLSPWTTDGTVEAFDLDGEGTLAVWFSSTTLLLASGAAVIVYLVRRYRRDDYQGTYRIWLWAAGCWLLMSLDETASLHEGFKKMMVLLTGQSLGGDGSLWWAIPYFFLLGGVGIRLLVDMRESLLSSATFLSVALCYATAVAAQLGWIFPQAGTLGIMVEEGAEMLGDWLLLLAMTLHARHVILDAEGRLSKKTRSRKSSKSSAEEGGAAQTGASLAGSSLVVHPPHGVGGPPSPHGGLSTPVGSASSVSLGSGSSWTGSGGLLASSAGTSGGAAPNAAGTGGMGLTEGSGSASSVPRRLTEAEKKALRRKLEKLRKQRESQGLS